MRMLAKVVISTLYLTSITGMAAPAEAKYFGSQTVGRLACADPTESVETKYGSTLYCMDIVNKCGYPIALTVRDNSTHVPHSTGQVNDSESGKVCTSHTNKIDHYVTYQKSSKDSSKGTNADESDSRSWIGTAVRFWVCSDSSQSTIRSDNSFEIWNGSEYVTLRLNGFEKNHTKSRSDYTVNETYTAEVKGNSIVIKGNSAQGDYKGTYTTSKHLAIITRSGSTCSCKFSSDRWNKYSEPQHFRHSSVYACR